MLEVVYSVSDLAPLRRDLQKALLTQLSITLVLGSKVLLPRFATPRGTVFQLVHTGLLVNITVHSFDDLMEVELREASTPIFYEWRFE